MNLEGSLEAFGLPDILRLLATTAKTGGLHLERAGTPRAVIRLRSGAVSGVGGQASQRALASRLVGSGLLDDQGLEVVVGRVRADPQRRLAVAVHEVSPISDAALTGVATEAVTDTVCELLRWNTGSFDFHVDEPDPDPLPVEVAVGEVIDEGSRRAAAWAELSGRTPAPDTVFSLSLDPPADPVLTREEWRLLALVDGRRAAGDVAMLLGLSDFAAMSGFAALSERGLVTAADPSAAGEPAGLLAVLQRRQELLAELDRPATDPLPPLEETAVAEMPTPSVAVNGQDAPTRTSRAEVPQPSPAPGSELAGNGSNPAGGAGTLAAAGAATVTVTEETGEEDAAVTKSLLLRLIAGVRGL
ncbi:MAG: DUF4388 domain-containing protein [Mycobacteriales bacterium]